MVPSSISLSTWPAKQAPSPPLPRTTESQPETKYLTRKQTIPFVKYSYIEIVAYEVSVFVLFVSFFLADPWGVAPPGRVIPPLLPTSVSWTETPVR